MIIDISYGIDKDHIKKSLDADALREGYRKEAATRLGLKVLDQHPLRLSDSDGYEFFLNKYVALSDTEFDIIRERILALVEQSLMPVQKQEFMQLLNKLKLA